MLNGIKQFSKQKRIKLVAIHEANYNRLRELGHTPDSFNDIIGRLLDTYERNRIDSGRLGQEEAALSK